MNSRERLDTIISSAGFGSIVLRDIPKNKVQLDLSIFSLKGGFRGFHLIPAGPHCVSVIGFNGEIYSFWCYLHAEEVIVKVFDPALPGLIDDTSKNTVRYKTLADSGAMIDALVPYNVQSLDIWRKLTGYIYESAFPLKLHPNPANVKNRFAHALTQVHGGQAISFMAEFQFAFASWCLNATDQTSLERWTYLVQAIYHAGERNMVQTPQLFIQLVDTLIVQFDLIQSSNFTKESPLFFAADYWIEDLIDTGNPQLSAKGKAFETYLSTRQ